jgi:TonB family protein
VSLLAEDHLRVSAPALVQAPVPAESRIALQDQQTGAAATPHQVTPENPIPRRTRGGNPAWPPSFAGRQFHVLAQTLVTLDRNGAVTAADRGGCQIVERPAVGEQNEEVCGAFSDAAASAIRQWRYERPLQAPLQFLVVATFEPGSDPTIAQSFSEWLRYVRETQESLRQLAGQTPRTSANEPGDTELARLSRMRTELLSRYREVEQTYRRLSERYTEGFPLLDRSRRELQMVAGDLAAFEAKLVAAAGASTVASPQQSAAAAKEEYERARLALERAQAQLLDAELREAARRLEASRQPEPAVAANVSPAQDAGASPLRSPSGRAPLRVGGSVSAPRVIYSPRPTYTAEAMKVRIEGTVAIQALVDEKGRVADARILKSIPLLDEQALAAAKQYEFTPALRNGEPVPVLVVIELEFNLRK